MGWLADRVMLGTLAFSVALHGALLSGSVPVEAARPRHPFELVSVELQPVEPQRPPPSLPPAPPAPPAPRPVVPRPLQKPSPASVPSRSPEVPTSRPARDAPEAPRPSVVLVPSDAFGLTIDAGITDERPSLTPRPIGELVSNLAKETLGRGRVDRGLVHPYYHDLGKALIKHWDADRVAAAGIKGFAEQASKNLKLYNDIWLERAAAFGQTGSPVDPGATAQTNNRRAPLNERVGGLSGIDLEAKKELHRVMTEQFKAIRRATLRVVQNADGRLVKVELVEPSNDETVDREALIDVKAAAEKLPPPPSEVLEGRSQLSSLWSFELIVSISPPVPTFSFEFDEALGFIDARLPLDRRIYKKVRLVSVE